MLALLESPPKLTGAVIVTELELVWCRHEDSTCATTGDMLLLPVTVAVWASGRMRSTTPTWASPVVSRVESSVWAEGTKLGCGVEATGMRFLVFEALVVARMVLEEEEEEEEEEMAGV